WEEPFGIVMIEAMACGTPVVALRGGAVPEVVVDGVTGFVCDRPEELATAIRQVGTLDPAACRRHVMAHFDVSALGYGYEQIYRKVLRRHAIRNEADIIEAVRYVEPDEKVSA
ncbi:MAG TPA: glycosyltransferase, partial [Mycobacterium sp.]|nr:glycosyltransferase [Mycobacterium sp.]